MIFDVLFIVGLTAPISAQVCSKSSAIEFSSQNMFERLALCALDEHFADARDCLNRLPPSISRELLNVSTRCSECYVNLIGILASLPSEIKEICRGDSTLPDCLGELFSRNVFDDFQACAGFSVSYPSCTSAQVRNKYDKGSLAKRLADALSGYSMYISDTPCDLAYSALFRDVKTVVGNHVGAISGNSSCLEENPSNVAVCLSKFPIILDYFTNNSGFEVSRRGPECTQYELSLIEELRPFEELIGCAFHPDSTSCDTHALIEGIRSISGYTCVGCYEEFLSSLKLQKAIMSTSIHCEDIYARECFDWIQGTLANLAECTGGPMWSSMSISS
jgi:hypothetical protein